MSHKKLPIVIEGIVHRKNQGVLEILALKRCPEDGGFWQPLTGTLELGESILTCLRREIEEEIGVSEVKTITEELYRFSWVKKDYTVVELVFGVELGPDQEIVLSKEHDEYRWCTPEEAFKLYEVEENREALRILLGRG